MMLNKKKLGMAVLTALLLTAGCEQKQTAQQHLTAAKAYVTEKESNKAIIELKNALSKEPNLDEARLMLGQLYLKTGEFLAAEIEFNKLYNSEFSSSKLLVDLAKARYLQQEIDTIPDLWQLRDTLSSAQTAQLGFYTYIAYKQLEDKQGLNQLKSALIPAKQDQTYTKLIIAYELAEKKQVEQALTTIENILLAEPENSEALLFKGQLYSFKRQYGLAISAFKTFLEVMPNYILTELYLADALFKNKEFEESRRLVDKLITRSPNFGYFNYLKGMLLFTENNFEESKLYLEKAIQSQTNVEQSKLYAGLSAFRTENYEQAYEYLTEVIDEVPNNDELRRILSVVQFNLGYKIEASDSIARLTELSERDLGLANEASFNFIRSGESEKAKRLIEQASKLNSDNAQEIAKLGMLKVSMQDMSGIVDIKKAIEIDSNIEQAKVALVQAYMGQGLQRDALDVAEKWIEDEPQNKNGYNLASFVAIGMRDLPLAEKYLTKALELDDGNIPSLMFLAGKAHNENDLDTAMVFLSKLIKHKPNYVPGLVNNYLISKQQGKADEGLALMELAYNKSSANPLLKLAYIRALYTEKKYNEVTALLTQYELSAQTPEFIWMLSVDTAVKADELSKASEIANAWTQEQPKSERAWASAIQLSSNKTLWDRIKLIEQALHIFPQADELRIMLAELKAITGSMEEAKQILSKTGSNSRAEVFVKSLINIKEKKFDDVIDAYESINSITEKESTMYIRALKGAGRFEQAQRLLNSYIDTYPQSTNLLFELVTLSSVSDIARKEQLYRKIIALDEKHVPALNNLSLLLLDIGEIEEGVDYAYKAFKLAPNYLPVIDTLAKSYAAQKDFLRASKIYVKLYQKTKEQTFLEQYIESLILLGDTNKIKSVMESHRSELTEAAKTKLDRLINAS